MIDQDLTGKLHAFEIRLPKLDAYLRFIRKARRLWQKPYTDSRRIELISAIEEKLAEYETPYGMKPYVTALKNELQSARDGIEQHIPHEELTITSFKRIEIKGKEIRRRIVASINDLRQNTSVFDRQEKDAVRLTLSKSRRSLQSLNRIKENRWISATAPVIPIADGSFIQIDKLQKCFRADDVSGYPVIYNQCVVGVNKAYLEKGESPLAVLAEALDKLKRDTGISYIPMLRQGSIYKKTGVGVLWYWLMSPQDAENFRRSFSSFGYSGKAYATNSISLRDWGFAHAD